MTKEILAGAKIGTNEFMDKRLTFQTNKFLGTKVFFCFLHWKLLDLAGVSENSEKIVKIVRIEKNYCNNPNGIKLLFGKLFL